jgi:hypothetical protein
MSNAIANSHRMAHGAQRSPLRPIGHEIILMEKFIASTPAAASHPRVRRAGLVSKGNPSAARVFPLQLFLQNRFAPPPLVSAHCSPGRFPVMPNPNTTTWS